MKNLILQGLNFTKPLSPNHQTVTAKKKANSSHGNKVNNAQMSQNVTLILSQATEPYRRDFMVFKIHSKVRSQLPNIESPVIVLRLRLNSKRLLSSKKNKQSLNSIRSKMYDNLCKSNKKRQLHRTTSVNSKSMRTISKEAFRLLNSTQICERLSKGKRLSNRHRRLKGRKIRIIVRVLDSLTGKKTQIFVKKVLLKRFKTISVPVPKNVFRAAAKSDDHALVVQVSCRNCKRFVNMDRVYRKGNKMENNNALRLNPNRPYLYIVTVHNDNTDSESYNVEEVHRSKRHVKSQNSCFDFNKTIEGGYEGLDDENFLTCCEERTYYSFEELGLSDIIVHPHGFFTVDCFGQCKDRIGKNIPVAKEYNQVAFNGLEDFDTALISDRRQSCVPTSKSSLDILYFVNSTTIIPKRFDNLIEDACGCIAG